MVLNLIMFKKKIKCKCGKKVDSRYIYCPFCGFPLNTKSEDQKNKELRRDIEPSNFLNRDLEKELMTRMPFLIRFPFKKLMKELTTEIDKQFKDMDKMIGETKKEKIRLPIHTQGISIKIESSLGRNPIIKIRSFGSGQKIRLRQGPEQPVKAETSIKEEQAKIPTKWSKAQQEKLARLPREEPKTSVRRLTDKIIYEIILPGVKSEKDIIINKLQNSIEIKAFAKDKAYFKLIPLAFPIKNYYLEKGKLVLELKP